MEEFDLKKIRSGGGENFIADDYYKYLDKVEKWLKASYASDSLTYKSRYKRLETINGSTMSDAEKKEILQKEFTQAFTETKKTQPSKEDFRGNEITELRASAEQGDANAQRELGECYEDGQGVYIDLEQAVFWYRKAAEQGDADAQYKLGECYENGRGIDIDLKQAEYWYRKAAEHGNADAQYHLGWCYENGDDIDIEDLYSVRTHFGCLDVDKDLKQAKFWYGRYAEQCRISAEQGDPDAQYKLGECYENGRGVDKDLKQAEYWYGKYAEQYRAPAEQGDSDAQYNLGSCYEDGLGVDQDPRQAEYWYRKAAEQGDVDAQYKLGSCYEDGLGVDKDLRQAEYWYRKAAEQGDADAQYNLGCRYEDGRGVPKDLKQAVVWYLKAAKKGHVKAQYKLRDCYYNGTGVAVSRSQARYWWEKATKGNPEMQFRLAYSYKYNTSWWRRLFSFSLLEDASCLLRKAALKGCADAQYELGDCYFKGKGVMENFCEAKYWYGKAAEQHADEDWVYGNKSAEARMMAERLDSFIWCAYYHIIKNIPLLIYLLGWLLIIYLIAKK